MAMEVSSRKKRKKGGESPEFEFRRALETCAREGDLRGALSLYRAAAAGENSDGPRLSAYLFNTLLHLCSSSLETLPESDRSSTIDFAFEIFGRMAAGGAVPTEATITSMSRIALRRPNGGADIAFDLVRTMRERYGAAPRLRTYSPVLLSFCQKPDAARAYEVESHMIAMGITPEEPEIAALLDASAVEGRGDNVYEYLHKLRRSVRCVAKSTAEVLERWFGGEKAAAAGVSDWDAGAVRDAMARNGGGWHGTGWLGSGAWEVRRASMEEEGRCLCCREVLACVDINHMETDKFANSVAALAGEREAVSNFSNFQVMHF